ncbi:hypothetical protein IW01_12490 [Pectobacterium brasiliense]|nr:hypothetical protein IW01_12490 [Pectobacterium brasiliense]
MFWISPPAWLQKEYDAMLDYVRSSTAPDPAQPILIAGESERISQAQRRADGIYLSDQEWQKIVEAGIALGMNPAEFTLIA